MTLYMPIGLPGCGKSTWAEQKDGAKVFSSDAIREEYVSKGEYASIDDVPNDIVFGEMEKRTVKAISRGESVVYDATSISRKDRRHILDKTRKFGVERVGVLFLVPVSVCKERNANRERVVPDFVYDKMTPQYMGETVKLGIYGINVVDEADVIEEDPFVYREFSLQSYLESLISESTAGYSTVRNYDETQILIKDLLNYGLAAQNFNEITPTIEEKTGTSIDLSTEVSDDLSITGEPNENLNWYSADIFFGDNITITFKFESNYEMVDPEREEVVSVSIVKDGAEVAAFSNFYTDENGKYCFDFTDIKPTEFYKVLTLNFKVNGIVTGETLTYSVNSYIARKNGKSSEVTQSLIEALAAYGKSAFALTNHASLNYSVSVTPDIDNGGTISVTNAVNGYNYPDIALPALDSNENYEKAWTKSVTVSDTTQQLTAAGTFAFTWNRTGYIGQIEEDIDGLIFVGDNIHTDIGADTPWDVFDKYDLKAGKILDS